MNDAVRGLYVGDDHLGAVHIHLVAARRDVEHLAVDGRWLRAVADVGGANLAGRAWLQFEVTGDDAPSVIMQTAIFEPRGLAGLLYWYSLYPIHWLIFAGMLRGIASHAAQLRR